MAVRAEGPEDRQDSAALSPMVLGYLRRLVPHDEAEDVLQYVLYEVWRHRDRYDPSEAWGVGCCASNTGIAVANLRVAVTQRIQQDGEWRAPYTMMTSFPWACPSPR
jgi:hypothetical protein